jgi:hypothetical protein
MTTVTQETMHKILQYGFQDVQMPRIDKIARSISVRSSAWATRGMFTTAVSR